MRVGELFGSAGLPYPTECGNIEICGIVTHSSLAFKGCMFISLAGYNSGGKEHIIEAVNNGTVVIVAEQVCDECVGGAAIIKIDNTRRAAALLYNVQCGKPSDKLKIIGVTGTNGKTSVCACLESIFLEAGKRCAVIGTTGVRVDGKVLPSNDGGGFTTPTQERLYPLLAKFVDMGVENVFMEVSSHALAQQRVAAIDFEYGIFTNLTRDHLDFHGTMEDYFLAKAALFKKCKKCVVNIDDPFGERLLKLCHHPITCSRVSGDAVIENIKCFSDGSEYTLKWRGGEFFVRLGAAGDFSPMNSAEAAAVALDMGIPPCRILRGLLRFRGAKGRMERVTPEGCGFECVIDFAHTPDALKRAALSSRVFRARGGRLITLFGCGGDRDRGKRAEMGRVASEYSDVIIITSDNPRSEEPREIIRQILKGVDKEKEYFVEPLRAEAIRLAVSLARAGDVILLCGKGHEDYEIDVEGKHPFDERAELVEAISKKYEA